MEVITKYVADDGTEFEFEDECLDYELKEKMKGIYGFKAYDSSAREIHPSDYDDLDDFATDMMFLKVTDVKGWEKFMDICDEKRVYFVDGVDEICEKGLFFFDEDHDYWTSWEAEYEKLRVIRRKMDY